MLVVTELVLSGTQCTLLFRRDDYHKQMSKALNWLSQDGHLIDIRDNIEDIPFRQKLSESLNSFRQKLKDFVMPYGSRISFIHPWDLYVITEAMGSKPGTSMKASQKDFLNWCLENGWDVDGSVDEKGA